MKIQPTADCNLEKSQGSVDIHLNQITAANQRQRGRERERRSFHHAKTGWLVNGSGLKLTADLP